MSVNRTRLMLRIQKYLLANSGGKKQTGETAFGIEACSEAQFVRRLRRGCDIGDVLLYKADKFLTDKGY